jgi:hypothetical protein
VTAIIQAGGDGRLNQGWYRWYAVVFFKTPCECRDSRISGGMDFGLKIKQRKKGKKGGRKEGKNCVLLLCIQPVRLYAVNRPTMGHIGF